MIEKKILRSVLAKLVSGGVRITYWDGTTETYGPDKPYLHITIKSRKVVRDVLARNSVGFGEAYMDGNLLIDGSIDQMIRLTAENKKIFRRLVRIAHTTALKKGYQRNKRSGQKRQIAHHYDIGNDFYKLWLDSSMTYSCAYFKKLTDTLEQAQQQKVGHILKKLQLKKGQTLLDIGSGWGTLAITAARQYGVKVTGISLSEEQVKHSKAAAKAAGVDKLVSFSVMNYQDLAESGKQFDRVVSVGMFEHVGRGNQDEYFTAISTLLKDKGLSVLHTISKDTEMRSDSWINKYIFPGGYIPSVRQVVGALPDYDFHLVDYENLRIHYAMTLDEWLRRFEKNSDKVAKMFDERFVRMWRFYLAASSGSFRYGQIGLSQFVFTKGNVNDLPLTREFLYK